ncbi:unnamed protein product [Trichogramma brassicae]|uniref:Uncharacterized protein n=1 Tax=Trichogramma brassicae TaxID=86971 RepID=A0A6H5HTS0_9HYME|nr:unnamed protein product [Trichogramma brassicae]
MFTTLRISSSFSSDSRTGFLLRQSASWFNLPGTVPQDDVPQTVKRVTCSLDQKKFEENVVRFILDNMLAFRIVETASFRTIFSVKSDDDLEMILDENDDITIEDTDFCDEEEQADLELVPVPEECITLSRYFSHDPVYIYV